MNFIKSSILLTLLLPVSFCLPMVLYRSPTRNIVSDATINTIDSSLQHISEIYLNEALQKTKADRGCVLAIDMQSGAIKVMVNQSTKGDAINFAVSSAWEPGSVIKPLLIASAIDSEKVNPDTTTFFNSNSLMIDGYKITNAIDENPGLITIQDIITRSINVGAVSVLQTMGNSRSSIDYTAQNNYYEYLTNHYLFGRKTNVTLPNEASGFIPRPGNGKDKVVVYANAAIGQNMTVTPLQLASAYAAILNGGTYYKPRIDNNDAIVLMSNVIKPETSSILRNMLKTAYETNMPQGVRKGFEIGGKTGTAHVSTITGDYKNHTKDIGTYIGYVSRADKAYVMLVRIDSPDTPNFASAEARELWLRIVTDKIDQTGTFIE